LIRFRISSDIIFIFQLGHEDDDNDDVDRKRIKEKNYYPVWVKRKP
jgi:hypothetical protein